jgi:hypothetical protein
MTSTVRVGQTWLETWEEDDPMGDAPLVVFRQPNGKEVTLAYLDHDDGVSGCDGEDQWGWSLVEDDGSWSYLGPDDKDRDEFLRQWVGASPKEDKEVGRWAVWHDGYENGLRGTYGVEPDGKHRKVSVHRTKKEAMEVCKKLQAKAKAGAHFAWYEQGNPGVLMPTYSVAKK